MAKLGVLVVTNKRVRSIKEKKGVLTGPGTGYFLATRDKRTSGTSRKPHFFPDCIVTRYIIKDEWRAAQV